MLSVIVCQRMVVKLINLLSNSRRHAPQHRLFFFFYRRLSCLPIFPRLIIRCVQVDNIQRNDLYSVVWSYKGFERLALSVCVASFVFAYFVVRWKLSSSTELIFSLSSSVTLVLRYVSNNIDGIVDSFVVGIVASWGRWWWLFCLFVVVFPSYNIGCVCCFGHHKEAQKQKTRILPCIS